MGGCTFVWLPTTTHPDTTHTGLSPKLPPRLHFCVVASHHTHTHHTLVLGPSYLPGCAFVWLPATTHTHTHHTLVLGPSYLPSCTFVWLPATTHTHTPHTGVRPQLPPRLHFRVVAS